MATSKDYIEYVCKQMKEWNQFFFILVLRQFLPAAKTTKAG